MKVIDAGKQPTVQDLIDTQWNVNTDVVKSAEMADGI